MQRIALWKFLLITIIMFPLALAFSASAFREESRRYEFFLAATGLWMFLLFVIHNRFWGYRQPFPVRFLLGAILITSVGLVGVLGGLMKGELWGLPAFLTLIGAFGVATGIGMLRKGTIRQNVQEQKDATGDVLALSGRQTASDGVATLPPAHAAPSKPLEQGPKNEALSRYLFRGARATRLSLNVMAALGILIAGGTFILIYDDLNKKWLGWAYFLLIVAIAVPSYDHGPLWAGFALLVWLAAWIHANLILSGYERAARQRVIELDRHGSRDVDTILEKAFLRQQVLKEGPVSCDLLAQTLQLPGGDSRLLAMAALVLLAGGKPEESAQFFERASANAQDQSQVEYVRKTRLAAEKIQELAAGG